VKELCNKMRGFFILNTVKVCA